MITNLTTIETISQSDLDQIPSKRVPKRDMENIKVFYYLLVSFWLQKLTKGNQKTPIETKRGPKGTKRERKRANK